MLEQYWLYFLIGGAALVAIGYVWLVFRAFGERVLWGIALLLPPLAVFFIAKHAAKARGPLVAMALGGLVFATPYGFSFYQRHFVRLGPHESIVDGELRITLTGLQEFNYSTLRERPDAAVLQMANKDVTDQTLQFLRDMQKLETLDLNDTQVTDKGLAMLAALPQLRELRLARTKITDEGFQKHLAAKDSLLKLDLTGTEVKGKTKREWKKVKPQEREYVD